MSNEYYEREERLIDMLCQMAREKPGVVPEVWIGIDEWIAMRADERIRRMDNLMPFRIAMAGDEVQAAWREQMSTIIHADIDALSERLRRERKEDIGYLIIGPAGPSRLHVDYDNPNRVELVAP